MPNTLKRYSVVCLKSQLQNCVWMRKAPGPLTFPNEPALARDAKALWILVCVLWVGWGRSIKAVFPAVAAAVVQ